MLIDNEVKLKSYQITEKLYNEYDEYLESNKTLINKLSTHLQKKYNDYLSQCEADEERPYKEILPLEILSKNCHVFSLKTLSNHFNVFDQSLFTSNIPRWSSLSVANITKSVTGTYILSSSSSLNLQPRIKYNFPSNYYKIFNKEENTVDGAIKLLKDYCNKYNPLLHRGRGNEEIVLSFLKTMDRNKPINLFDFIARMKRHFDFSFYGIAAIGSLMRRIQFIKIKSLQGSIEEPGYQYISFLSNALLSLISHIERKSSGFIGGSKFDMIKKIIKAGEYHLSISDNNRLFLMLLHSILYRASEHRKEKKGEKIGELTKSFYYAAFIFHDIARNKWLQKNIFIWQIIQETVVLLRKQSDYKRMIVPAKYAFFNKSSFEKERSKSTIYTDKLKETQDILIDFINLVYLDCEMINFLKRPKWDYSAFIVKTYNPRYVFPSNIEKKTISKRKPISYRGFKYLIENTAYKKILLEIEMAVFNQLNLNVRHRRKSTYNAEPIDGDKEFYRQSDSKKPYDASLLATGNSADDDEPYIVGLKGRKEW